MTIIDDIMIANIVIGLLLFFGACWVIGYGKGKSND
jgi:hypothetical protein